MGIPFFSKTKTDAPAVDLKDIGSTPLAMQALSTLKDSVSSALSSKASTTESVLLEPGDRYTVYMATPTTIGDDGAKATLFTMTVSDALSGTSWKVSRRYSDFAELKNELGWKRVWLSVALPPKATPDTLVELQKRAADLGAWSKAVVAEKKAIDLPDVMAFFGLDLPANPKHTVSMELDLAQKLALKCQAWRRGNVGRKKAKRTSKSVLKPLRALRPKRLYNSARAAPRLAFAVLAALALAAVAYALLSTPEEPPPSKPTLSLLGLELAIPSKLAAAPGALASSVAALPNATLAMPAKLLAALKTVPSALAGAGKTVTAGANATLGAVKAVPGALAAVPSKLSGIDGGALAANATAALKQHAPAIVLTGGSAALAPFVPWGAVLTPFAAKPVVAAASALPIGNALKGVAGSAGAAALGKLLTRKAVPAVAKTGLKLALPSLALPSLALPGPAGTLGGLAVFVLGGLLW